MLNLVLFVGEILIRRRFHLSSIDFKRMCATNKVFPNSRFNVFRATVPIASIADLAGDEENHSYSCVKTFYSGNLLAFPW